MKKLNSAAGGDVSRHLKGTAHHHHLREPSGQCRIGDERRREIGQGADGNDGQAV